MKDTKIEWCHHSFNPWIGCTKVSPACDNCYAEKSMPAKLQGVTWGAGQPRKRTSEANWKQPIKWNAEAERLGVRYRVFCASLSDVFDNAVPGQWRADLFQLIEDTPHLDWLLLTKRIGNAESMINDACSDIMRSWREPWSNVWLGATICNQKEAYRDIPKLLAVPAVKRFLSMEPLLGPVSFVRVCSQTKMTCEIIATLSKKSIG
jgi:protein gp37